MYNALDNIEQAKQLREQLILEQADIRASLDYMAHVDNQWDDNAEQAIADIQAVITAIGKYISAVEAM